MDTRISSSSPTKKTMSRLKSSGSSRFKDSRGPIPCGRWITRCGDSKAGRSDSTGSRKLAHDVLTSSVMSQSVRRDPAPDGPPALTPRDRLGVRHTTTPESACHQRADGSRHTQRARSNPRESRPRAVGPSASTGRARRTRRRRSGQSKTFRRTNVVTALITASSVTSSKAKRPSRLDSTKSH